MLVQWALYLNMEVAFISLLKLAINSDSMCFSPLILYLASTDATNRAKIVLLDVVYG